jgi:hypothetical protein
MISKNQYVKDCIRARRAKPIFKVNPFKPIIPTVEVLPLPKLSFQDSADEILTLTKTLKQNISCGLIGEPVLIPEF